MKSVLSVTSECAPLVKTGGLADVAGALPHAMAATGWSLRTLLPGYPSVMAQLGRSKPVLTFPDLMGGPARLIAASLSGLDLLVLDAPHLYDRPGTPYLDESGVDFPDNPERFAALCWAAAEIARGALAGYRPDLVHCHDWQAGFTPYYLRDTDVPSILTIHNMAFQGLAPASRLAHLRLDSTNFNSPGFEYWGNVSALKAGLNWASRITTVSPTYAAELMTAEFGNGLEGVLRARERDFSGILNGIDTEAWNPATDPAIETYGSPEGKAPARAALRREFGLPEADGPLCVVVSRLSQQKGLDMLLDAMPALIDRGGQVLLLGSGERDLESRWRAAASHPNVAVHIGYDEAMSHRIIAGGDAILVPSRFEPCGLTQLYGLRYGTVPVVARTGGLADTVIDASPMALRAGVATGIQFAPLTVHALASALMRTLDLYHQPTIWSTIQRNAMRQDVGWEASAPEYARLYDEVTRSP